MNRDDVYRDDRYCSPRVAFAVVASVFFMWGFITVLNDVLIPHLKGLFTLNYAQAMLVQFIFFGAYFVMSIPAGKLVARLGYRGGIIAGLLVAGAGALLFVPAARAVSYGLFLSAFFVLASGITLLQVAANPYVSLAGDPRHASSRLNLAQALNSLGTTLAPAIGGLLILSGPVLDADAVAALGAEARHAYRLAHADAVVGPYLGIAAVLGLLALSVRLFRLPPLRGVEGGQGDASGARGGFLAALRHRHVRSSVLAIFLYVGAEVSVGSFLINYLSMPSVGGLSHAQAAFYVSLYWGGAMVGRFVGSAALRYLDPRRALAGCALAASALLVVTMLGSGQVALWSVVAIGLCNSIMFPNIFTFGIERMGALTGKAASLLIMAIVGGALVPLLQGVVADRLGLGPSFAVPLVCYLFIVAYGLVFSRADSGEVDAEAAEAAAASPLPPGGH